MLTEMIVLSLVVSVVAGIVCLKMIVMSSQFVEKSSEKTKTKHERNENLS